jgi:hypothetical protein
MYFYRDPKANTETETGRVVKTNGMWRYAVAKKVSDIPDLLQ